MRIISWNMQGQVWDPINLRNALNDFGADAVLMQEPYLQLDISGISTDDQQDGGRKTRHTPVAKGDPWTITWIKKDGHDRCAVALRQDVQLDQQQICDSPDLELEAGPRDYALMTLKKGGEQLVIATCHAPYKSRESSDSVLYMNALFAELDKGSESAAKASVQVFMGDTNVYNIGNELKPKGWSCVLQSTTGGQGKKGGAGGPLDRIYIRDGQLMQATEKRRKIKCGRIYQKTSKVDDPSRADRSNEGIFADSPREEDVWSKSDHLAIYLDTKGETPSGSVVAQPTKRQYGEDVELDYKGNLQKVAKKQKNEVAHEN